MSVVTQESEGVRRQPPDGAAVESRRHNGAAPRRRRMRACWRGLLGAAVVCLSAAPWTAGALAAPEACPTVMPVSEVKAASDGAEALAGTGLTVSRGTEPEAFDVRVLGVLEDGIGPDVDMIIVATDSPTLERIGGIWAGMSGSPVYAADGRWIGAVAYGFSFGPSKIAGVTPAEDMVQVLGYGTAAAAPVDRDRVRLSRALRREIAALPDVSARQAAAGLVRLPVPLGVSGLRAARVEQLASRLDPSGRMIPYLAGAAGANAGDVAQIKPGGNFAAALAYGDVSAAGVGTTTAVCDGMALAFGHPFLFRGEVSMSAHTATTITIPDDPTLTPFKLANVGGIVGTVDQDRLVAIRARLDGAPSATEVTSTVSDTGTGAARSGTTTVNDSRDVPVFAPAHLIANIDRVIDRVGSGRSRVTWTVTGAADGQPFALTRENRFAVLQDPSNPFADISLASSEELARHLGALYTNRFAQVAFTGVRIDAEVAPQFRRFRIDALERRVGTRWVPVNPRAAIPAIAGRLLALRARLSSFQNPAGNRTVEFTLAIPAAPAPSTATLEVRGGERAVPEEAPAPDDEASSFANLLTSLRNAVRNDEIVAELKYDDDSGQAAAPAASARRRLDEVVNGNITVAVNVQPPPGAN